MKNKFIFAFALNAAIFAAHATQVTDSKFCISGGDTFKKFSITDSIGGILTAEPISNQTSCLKVSGIGDNSPTVEKKDFVENGLKAAGIPWEPTYMVSTYVMFEAVPSRLNFAFAGDMEIQQGDSSYICKNVYIGQGSSGLVNNWWLFNNNNTHQQSIVCNNVATSEEKYFYPYNDSLNHYTLALLDNPVH